MDCNIPSSIPPSPIITTEKADYFSNDEHAALLSPLPPAPETRSPSPELRRQDSSWFLKTFGRNRAGDANDKPSSAPVTRSSSPRARGLRRQGSPGFLNEFDRDKVDDTHDDTGVRAVYLAMRKEYVKGKRDGVKDGVSAALAKLHINEKRQDGISAALAKLHIDEGRRDNMLEAVAGLSYDIQKTAWRVLPNWAHNKFSQRHGALKKKKVKTSASSRELAIAPDLDCLVDGDQLEKKDDDQLKEEEDRIRRFAAERSKQSRAISKLERAEEQEKRERIGRARAQFGWDSTDDEEEDSVAEEDFANVADVLNAYLRNLSKRVSVFPDDVPIEQEAMDTVEQMTRIGKGRNVKPNSHRRRESSIGGLKALLKDWEQAQAALGTEK